MAKVTILVTVKNKVDTIGLCMESLLKVKYAPLVTMVVDGYSTDGSFDILREYEGRIQLYQVKGNLSTALNWALRRINTEYVALTDADCVVAEDWIDELLKGFDAEDVIATAGHCGTPPGLTGFQEAIGLELESRFRRFPPYILRAPTMNLCLKTAIAREVGFDEGIDVGIETEFGYRLTKLGRMRYVPDAKIWHYHRSTRREYFRQKRDQARGAVQTYLRHRNRIRGDHISTPLMMIQVPIAGMIIVGLLLSALYYPLMYLVSVCSVALLVIYGCNLVQITKKAKHYPYLLTLFLTRTLAWVCGCVMGIWGLLARTTKRR